MKKIFCITLALLMMLGAIPFVASAENAEPVATTGVQSNAASDAQITSNVLTIWYDNNGTQKALGNYNNMDDAFEALRALYVGPLADESITDENGNGLSDELYAAAGSPVIKINGNFVGDYARPNWATNNGSAQIKYDMNKVITIVIDGAKNENENWTITYGSNNYNTQTFNYLAYYNLTIKNTNMLISMGGNTTDGVFLWQGNSGDGGAPGTSYTTFENCLIQQTATNTNGNGCLFKMNGKAKFNGTLTEDPCKTDKYNLILKDTTVETGTGIGHQAHWGADVNIELHNSMMALIGGAGDGYNNNDALLKFYEAGVGRVYLDATSKLVSKRTRATATTCLIRVLSSQKATVSIELDAGAELVMLNSAALKQATYIAADGPKSTITDRGAVYTASVTDAKNGVVLPLAFKDATWLVGTGAEVQVGHPVTVDSDTGDETVDTSKIVYKDANATHYVSMTATGTAPVSIKKNGETVDTALASINAAFDYVYSQADSEDYTIYLNGSLTIDDYFNPETYDSTAVRTVRIDGQGYNLTSYSSTATFYGIGLFNLKLSNINIISSAVSALDWSPRKTPSDAYANYIATGSNPVVDTYAEFVNVAHAPRLGCNAGNLKLKGGNSGAQNKGTYNITMIDSVFKCTATDTMFMMNDKGNLNLNVIGTEIIYYGGASNNDGNNYIFALNGAKVDINVDGNSVIKSASTSTRVTSGIFYNGTNYAVNVTLAEGAELYLTGNDSKTSAKFFGAEKATTKIVDNGAKWVVGKDLLDNGAVITLPTSMFKDAAKDHVWYVGGDAVANPYGNATATADVTLTHAIPVDPAEGKVAYIEIGGEKTYYATLSSAINALGALYDAVTTENLTDDALWQAAGSPVIYLYEDITIASETYPSWGTATNYDANRVRTVVIEGAKDGTNPLITSTVGGAAFGYLAYYNLTLKNIDLTCTQGFALFWRGYNGNKAAKSTTNMINCNISATGTSGEGLVFKVTGNQNQTKTENFIINVVNTDIVAQKGVNAMFLFHHGCAGTLNIDGDSTLHHIQNKSADGGDTMFMLGTNRKFVINIDDGAKLSADLQVGKNGSYKSYAIFRIEGSDSYASADGIKNEINIGNNVEMSITGNGDFNMPAYFIQNNLVPTETAKKTIVNIGENVIMSVDANVAADGFGAYVGQACNFGAILGANHNGDTTKLYNSVVPAGAITEAVANITPVFYNPADFALFKGASIRTVVGEDGIRFSAYYSNTFYNLIKNYSPVFGTLVVPSAKLGSSQLTLDNAASLTALNVKSTKTHVPGGVGNADKTYHTAIIMPNSVDDAQAYQLALAARGYVTLTYADGSTGTIYTVFDPDKNVRSMYQTAKNLVEKDPANLNDEAIKSIIDTIETTAASIIASNAITSKATVMASAPNCKEIEVSGTAAELQGIINDFVAKGFKEVSVNKISSNKSTFEVVVYANGADMVTFYKFGTTSMKIMYEDRDLAGYDVLTPNATTGTGSGQMVQLGIDRGTANDNPMIGLCIIVKLGDGRAMIVDGGINSDAQADNIYNAFKTLGIKTDSQGRYIIANWIFTHSHGDHIGAFQSFTPLYKDKVVLERVMMNMPAADALAGYGGATAINFDKFVAKNYPGVKRINPHSGLTYFIGNASIEMFYTPDSCYTTGSTFADYNNTSLVFRIQIGNNSAFIYGDSGNDASTAMLNMYGTSSTEFKSDILQITHHGLYTSEETGHEWTNLKKVYDLVGAKYAFLPLGTQYAEDTRDGRASVMCDWAKAGYQISYVMNMNNIPTVCGTTIENDEFKEFDQTGKVTKLGSAQTVSSIFGYNGKNMITNGKGLTTYLSADNNNLWVTVFNFGSGTISAPAVNTQMSSWLQ